MRRSVASLILAFISFVCAAQTEATAYFMNFLPQVSDANPAFVPKYKYSIGLPGLASIATTYTNNGFAYKDLITHSDGTTHADLTNWNNVLAKKNYITNSIQADLLRVGFTASPRLYFQFSSTVHSYIQAYLPKNLTSLVANGNAGLTGTTTHFSPSGEGISYITTGLSAAWKFDQRLTLGVRANYLQGLIDATTVRSDIDVAVADNYAVTAAADLRLRTSGVYDASQKGYSFGKEYKHYRSNNGGSVDLGATYQVSSRLTVAASLKDLGKIYWKNNLYDYVLDKATANYSFSGIDADKLVQGNTSYLGAQGDSIKKKFVFQKEKSSSYSTWLPLRLYLSGSYSLPGNMNAGLLVFSERFGGRLSQGASASLNKSFGRWLGTTVSYTVSNRSYTNFGAGLVVNVAPVQLYVVGDNLLNAPVSLLTTQHLNSYINSTQVFSLRAGLNFVLGWKKPDPREAKPAPASKPKSLLKVRQKRK